MNIFRHWFHIFFWIAASVADADAVHHNGIKTLLAIGFSTFFIKGKPFYSNILSSIPKNPRDWPILDNLVFKKFILANEPFAKALPFLENCIFVNYNLWGKLVSVLESPATFDERFDVTKIPFFILKFHLLSWIRQFYI